MEATERPGIAVLLVLLLAPVVVMVFDVKPVSASVSDDYIRYAEDAYYASGYSILGTYNDTRESDGKYHCSKGERTPVVPRMHPTGGYILDVHYNFTTGGLKKNQISRIEVKGEARTDRSSRDFTVGLFIYNYGTAGWDFISSFYGTESDTNITWTYATEPPNYTTPYVDDTGNMTLRWWFWVEDFSELWTTYNTSNSPLDTGPLWSTWQLMSGFYTPLAITLSIIWKRLVQPPTSP